MAFSISFEPDEVCVGGRLEIHMQNVPPLKDIVYSGLEVGSVNIIFDIAQVMGDSFAVILPADIEPGSCTVECRLETRTGGEIDALASSRLQVTPAPAPGPSPQGTPHITSITPSTIAANKMEMERIALKGTTLDKIVALTTTPYCSPSKLKLMTGASEELAYLSATNVPNGRYQFKIMYIDSEGHTQAETISGITLIAE